jgi:hypothetical protein
MIATKGGVMNVAYLSASSALTGSALGGMASIVTTWLNQHSQDRWRGSNEGHTRSRVDAARAGNGTLIFSDVVQYGSMRWRSGAVAGE